VVRTGSARIDLARRNPADHIGVVSAERRSSGRGHDRGITVAEGARQSAVRAKVTGQPAGVDTHDRRDAVLAQEALERSTDRQLEVRARARASRRPGTTGATTRRRAA